MHSITLVGVAARPVNLQYSGDGRAFGSFSLAVDESYKDRDGVKVERTMWTNCLLNGPIAESMASMIEKGTHLTVIGTLDFDAKTGGPKLKPVEDGGIEYGERHTVSGNMYIPSFSIKVDQIRLQGRGRGGSDVEGEDYSQEQVEPTPAGKKPF